MTREEYGNVKKFYQTLELKDLGELNKIYNFQDTVILCQIFEQRSKHLQKLFKFNPRKCNCASSFSASSFSECLHRNKSKCLIALSTVAEHVRVFEKALIGGFSIVNTRLAFHSQILLPEKENEKVILDLDINEKKKQKGSQQKFLRWMKMINTNRQ